VSATERSGIELLPSAALRLTVQANPANRAAIMRRSMGLRIGILN